MRIKPKIWNQRWILRAIIPSLIFNFRHLPFSQARKLPILLFKARLLNNSGSIRINGPVRFGMIRLGVDTVSLFPNNGITIENRGLIIFNGKAIIGNNSAISLSENGILEFGEKFCATTGLKLACYYHICFGNKVLIGWNVQIIDTDFHALKNVESGELSPNGFGSIIISHDVWIANGCKIYKNVSIPHSCVVGGDTILHKAVDCPPYSIITNVRETRINTTAFFRDMEDDKIQYRKYEE